METFEFKSAICTSVKQSKRLLKLGLKKETADMCYKVTTHDWKGKEIPEKERRYSLCAFYDEIDLVCGFQRTKTIPAWSLHRLLCMLPIYVRKEYIDYGRKYIAALDLIINEDLCIGYKEGVDEPCYDKFFYAKDIYTSLCDCIEWLIKEGYFNKDYLEEKL